MQLLKIYQVRLHAILAVAGICASTITAVQGQTLVTDFTAGQPSGQYSFASWTPKSLPEFMKGNAQQNSVNIVGHLFLPPGDEKVPVVLMMHGSGGIYSACWGTGRTSSMRRVTPYCRSIRSVRAALRAPPTISRWFPLLPTLPTPLRR
jgi:hypothetical protein